MESIKEAKSYLRENFEEGATCPCCGQFVKLYKRKLNSGMASTLIRIYRDNQQAWTHVKNFLRENKYQNSHDWTRLKDWGLLEEQENTETTKKTSGTWRITDRGVKFIMGQIAVPSHIFIYNNSLQGYSNTEINIYKALGKHFNYTQLMNNND